MSVLNSPSGHRESLARRTLLDTITNTIPVLVSDLTIQRRSAVVRNDNGRNDPVPLQLHHQIRLAPSLAPARCSLPTPAALHTSMQFLVLPCGQGSLQALQLAHSLPEVQLDRSHISHGLSRSRMNYPIGTVNPNPYTTQSFEQCASAQLRPRQSHGLEAPVGVPKAAAGGLQRSVARKPLWSRSIHH